MDSLGPLVRLEGISTSQLPSGEKGSGPAAPDASADTSGDGSRLHQDVKSFIAGVLSESIPFIDGVSPKSGGKPTWKLKGSAKRYQSCSAPVHLYERGVTLKELEKIPAQHQTSKPSKSETWFCRKSCHINKVERGTASWEEFWQSFKVHHAETEDAFTPTIIGAREAMSWDTTGIEVEVHGEKWINITVAVEEMKHQIDPKPLKNRTFPVVQVAAQLEGAQEFIVVSIPITDFEKSQYADFAKDKSLVVAAYTSIERVRIPQQSEEIEWIMATASDAKGVLPQWMQNLAVPNAIAKDVNLFMTWILTQRDS